MEEYKMEFFSEKYFRDAFSHLPIREQRSFSAVNRAVDAMSETYDVFLSYNIEDQNVVKGIYYVLTKRYGLKVYLDCIVDSDLVRSATDKTSAKRIQNRLLHSKSLLYAQSPSAGRSNWMPWELGVVDGKTGKCMIMPVTNDTTRVSPKREYLLLYPYVRPDSKNEMRIFVDGYSVMGKGIADYIRY